MIRRILLCVLLSCLATGVSAAESPRVAFITSKGDIVIELNAGEAPETVENFLQYVRDDFYDGTIFHRAVYGWIIQGGGYNQELEAKETRDPIRSEATNGLKNESGTIAMARFSDPHSADSQFFINLKDNSSFDHTGRTPARYGYTVFGRVVEGMEVVAAIASLQKVEKPGFGATFPEGPDGPVVLKEAVVLE